ncbi:MAG: family transporter [Firmicutes bacterium]|nr:family transporter [Bacillota bacterium]
MLQNFIISLQAVLPLFFMMMIGALVRRKGWLNLPELPRLNGMIFKTLFPFTVFSSLYGTDLTHSLHPGLIAFSVGAVLLTILVSLWIVPKLEPNNRSRGAMIQGIYRSNFVLLGLPLAANLYPGADLGMPAIIIAVLIPVYNVMAVIILECYRGERPSPGRIIRGVFTNPLILGCIAGLLCIPLDLPRILDQTISQLGAAATPMALILLGASFQFQHSPHLRRNLRIVTFCRLLLVPGIFLSLAALLGFRDMAFVTLLGVFSAPCAVSSFTMAEQMDSDGELAGAAVVYTSLFSCATMFLWTFLFKQLGMF